MQILLDDTPCDLSALTVGEALDAASAIAVDRGRLIVTVDVDGTAWTADDLASTKRAAPARVVRLTTAEPRKVICRAFAEAADALTDADRLQRQAAELLQSGKQAVSMDILSEAVSIWMSVRETVVKGASLGRISLDDAETGGAVSRLNERLKSVRDALQARDPVGLADELLYQFPAVVEEWRGILARLQRIAERQ